MSGGQEARHRHGITWVTDADRQAVQLLLLPLQNAHGLDVSRRSFDGEGFGRGVRVLRNDGVGQLRVERPFFVGIVDQQLSHQTTWTQQQPRVLKVLHLI